MNTVTSPLGTLWIALLLLALLLIETLVAGLGIVLVGRVLATVSGLGLFEASLIALGVALVIVGVGIIVLRTPPVLQPIDLDEEDDDGYDDIFDEDEMEYAPPPSRNDPCPCGSGRKYKNCHGRNV